MKTPYSLFSTFVAGAALALSFSTAHSAVVTWGGSTGDYGTAGNWLGGNVPNTNGGDTALINSGNAVYTPGGDLPIHSGGAITVNGGSWTQVGGIAWIQASGGSINVQSGTFSQGTAQNIIITNGGALNVSGGVFNQSTGSGFQRNATSTISVSGGTANFAGNFLYDQTNLGTFAITGGGMVNIEGEFKPLETFTMTTGMLTSTLISFADGPGSINLTGGTIAVDGSSFYSGFYGGGAKGVNFTTGSNGTLFFENYTAADLAADGFLTNGTIQYNGAASAGSFTVLEQGGGVYVTLTVPEPTSVLLVCGGLSTVLFFRRRARA
jgi:hypothetical protein